VVRALASHARGHWFKSSIAHHKSGKSELDFLVFGQIVVVEYVLEHIIV
jgi:uncharacterized membrane protein YsdA (DUF1294 family)